MPSEFSTLDYTIAIGGLVTFFTLFFRSSRKKKNDIPTNYPPVYTPPTPPIDGPTRPDVGTTVIPTVKINKE